MHNHSTVATMLACRAPPQPASTHVARSCAVCSVPLGVQEFAVLRKRYSPADLAFMGDAVWTLHVRQKHLLPPKHISSYRASADQQVTADTQHTLCDLLLEWGQSHLGPEPGQEPPAPAAAPKGPGPPSCCCFSPSQAELQLLHWAVQQQAGDERQRFKGNASRMASYRKATAFEALLGGLLLTQPGRLAQLLACLPAA
ncbi:hypothetical protein V8C86DRAFT_1220244 [Haematococcus lacustris]